MMMNPDSLYPAIGLVYLLLLVPVSLLAWKFSGKRTASEYYLAGRSLGPFILLLTIFATTYSCNSLMSHPGEAWQRGFSWMIALSIPLGAVLGYHLIVPALRALPEMKQFVSPGDWIDFRFRNDRLRYPLKCLLAIVMLVVCINTLFAQLKAMGEIAEAMSGGYLKYQHGVLILALVVLLYDLAGGLRAVAWTDVFQGCLMIGGLAILFFWLFREFSSPADVTALVAQWRPESLKNPDMAYCLRWLSTILLIGMSIIVYPQTMQRYFAAQNNRAAYMSMAVFGVLLVCMKIVLIFVGIAALDVIGNQAIPRDQLIPVLLRELSGEGVWFSLGGGMVFLALCAAIMSTADSVLLSTVSILRRDFSVQPVDDSKMGIDILLTVIVISGAVLLAMYRDITLWRLIELKMEALIQCFPAFVLCLYLRRLSAGMMLTGLVTGLATYLSMLGLGVHYWQSIHAGVWALAVNMLVCLAMLVVIHNRQD